MRRFLITSQRYTGQAELVYNDKETLCLIDCTKTDMDEQLIGYFKKIVPVTIHELQAGYVFSADTVIVEEGFVVSFKRFYDDYPLKRNRFRAEKIFDKLSSSDQVKAFYSLSGYKKYISRTNIFCMCADKYLSDKHYETNWNKI